MERPLTAKHVVVYPRNSLSDCWRGPPVVPAQPTRDVLGPNRRFAVKLLSRRLAIFPARSGVGQMPCQPWGGGDTLPSTRSWVCHRPAVGERKATLLLLNSSTNQERSRASRNRLPVMLSTRPLSGNNPRISPEVSRSCVFRSRTPTCIRSDSSKHWLKLDQVPQEQSYGEMIRLIKTIPLRFFLSLRTVPPSRRYLSQIDQR